MALTNREQTNLSKRGGLQGARQKAPSRFVFRQPRFPFEPLREVKAWHLGLRRRRQEVRAQVFKSATQNLEEKHKVRGHLQIPVLRFHHGPQVGRGTVG